MSQEHVVENFFGVYLLYCKNPKYLGKVYIGYTVDPNRRIKQHNKGKKAGGAWKTSKKGPWDMVLIVHGFPNDIAALRFEWAWQHPHSSRRLQHVAKKTSRESVFEFTIRVLSEMLRAGPWNRLPLSIRWTKQEYFKEFPERKRPPMHMPVIYGSVTSKRISRKLSNSSDVIKEQVLCYICAQVIDEKPLTCLNKICNCLTHVNCLSSHFLECGEYIPIEGCCPKCNTNFLWGDVIRKFKGCYGAMELTFANEFDDITSLY